MTKKNFPFRSLLLIAVLGVAGGCMDAAGRKDMVISQMIKGGMAVKGEVLASSDGSINDYKVFRDGEKDGVIFEYTFAKDVVIDRTQLTSENVKQGLKEALASDVDSKRALALGIYARMVYLTIDGEIVCEATITANDL